MSRNAPSQLEKELLIRQTHLRSIYDPKTAFGNKEIIDCIQGIEMLLSVIESDSCGACYGTGMVEHDCNCDRCHNDEIECEMCDGTGKELVNRRPLHMTHV